MNIKYIYLIISRKVTLAVHDLKKVGYLNWAICKMGKKAAIFHNCVNTRNCPYTAINTKTIYNMMETAVAGVAILVVGVLVV